MSNPTLFIGIDPGKKTGLAYWHAKAKELNVLPAWPFWKAWDEVRSTVRRAQEQGIDVCAVVEDPTQNAPVWSRGGQHGRKHVKIAQNVGSNKRDAQLWISGLERLGIEVKKVRPQRSKWTRSTHLWAVETELHVLQCLSQVFVQWLLFS